MLQKRPAVLAGILLSMALALSACTDYHAALIDIGSETERQIERTCEKMTGKKEYSLSVPKGERLEIRFDITVKEGALDIALTGSGEEELYKGTLTESDNFTIPLEADADYTLTATGSNYSGNYSIQWGDPPEESKGGAS